MDEAEYSPSGGDDKEEEDKDMLESYDDDDDDELDRRSYASRPTMAFIPSPYRPLSPLPSSANKKDGGAF